MTLIAQVEIRTVLFLLSLFLFFFIPNDPTRDLGVHFGTTDATELYAPPSATQRLKRLTVRHCRAGRRHPSRRDKANQPSRYKAADTSFLASDPLYCYIFKCRGESPV